MNRLTAKKIGKSVGLYVPLLAGALVMIFPFLWMVMSSFKLPQDVITYPIEFFPKKPTLAEYTALFERAPILRYLANSAICTAYQVIGSLFFSSLAGFAFAKIRFPGRNIVFIFVLITMFTPIQIRLVPLYLLLVDLNLIDTYHGIVLPMMLGPISIFLMRQGMLGIPNELMDAARIDGCSLFGIYWKIALPLCRPMIGTLAVFSFIWSWGSFLWPLIVVTTQEMRTIELGAAMFRNMFYVEYGLMMAVATLAVIPTLVFFLLFQRLMIKTVARTGLKM